jgi:hypothetical protein
MENDDWPQTRTQMSLGKLWVSISLPFFLLLASPVNLCIPPSSFVVHSLFTPDLFSSLSLATFFHPNLFISCSNPHTLKQKYI